MKRLFLVIVMTFFVTGCVYSRAPYGHSSGYSSYGVISTPSYPRYEVPHYYKPAPLPPQRYYYEEQRPRFRSHEHNERSHSRQPHHRW